MTQVVVTGSLAFDQIMLYPGSIAEHIMPDMYHVISTSFLVEHLEKNQGGVAGNLSYNLGLLGHTPVCLGSVGRDGNDYVHFLEKNSVNTEFIQQVKTDYTASFAVITDRKDCQISGFYEGAMKHDVNLAVKKVLDSMAIEPKDAFLIIAPTNTIAMSRYIAEAHAHGIRYLFSPAQQTPYLSMNDLMAGVDGASVVIGNDYEIAQLLDKTGMTKEELLNRAQVLIETIGERGSVIMQKDKQEIAVGVVKPKIVRDPTGIGDAYIAGFVDGYLQDKPLVECAQRGATAAAFALEEYGTTNHSFSKPIFENKLKENFG